MNNVYITCKIKSKSNICFDYYNKVKPYCIMSVEDIDNEENVFDVVIYGKICEDFLNRLYINTIVLICGDIRIEEEMRYIYAKKIYIV